MHTLLAQAVAAASCSCYPSYALQTSKPVQPWVMEQDAAPEPRAAGRKGLAPFFGEMKIDWELS